MASDSQPGITSTLAQESVSAELLDIPRVSIFSNDDSDDEAIFHDALTSPAAKPTAEDKEENSLHGAQEASEVAQEGESEKPALDPEQLRVQTAEKAFSLVEFYFGDDNYSKDQFLRKQASQDATAQGWIPVDVITSFKKMKKVTESREVVVEAMKKSALVVLSEDTTLVRRAEPLAKDVEDALTRTLVLGKIPTDSTDESVRAICAPHGAITRVRFVVYGRDELPDDVRRFCLDERGLFKSGLRMTPDRLYALVEYGATKYANIAVRALPNEQDWRGGLQAMLLHKRVKGDASPCSSQSVTREASPCVTPTVSSLIVERARANSLNARIQRERSSSATAGLSNSGTEDATVLMADAAPDLPNFSSSQQRPSSATTHGPEATGGVSGGAGDRWCSPSRQSPRATSSRSPSLSPQSARRHLSAPNSHAHPTGHLSPTPRSNLSQSASPQTWRHTGASGSSGDQGPAEAVPTHSSPLAAAATASPGHSHSPGHHQSPGHNHSPAAAPGSPQLYRASGISSPSPLRAAQQRFTRQPLGPDGSKGFAARKEQTAN